MEGRTGGKESREGGRKGELFLLLRQDIHLFLPLDNKAFQLVSSLD